jgi:hypothetical protein
MPLPEDRRAQTLQRYLYPACAIAGVGLIFSIWRGWVTEAWFTEGVPVLIFVVIFAIMMRRGPLSALERPPSYTLRRAAVDLSKAVLCWIITFVWILLTVHRVPDSYVGAAILFGPALGIGLWGIVYLIRPYRWVFSGILGALVIPRTVPSAMLDADPVAARDTPGVIEIPVAYRATLLRYAAALLLYVGLWWLLGRNNWLVSFIVAAGVLFALYLGSQIFFGHGPGLVMAPSGISLRKGIGTISHIAWSDATTLEIKATPLYSCLAIGMRNAQQLIDNASGYQRYSLRSNLQMFGSPVVIFTLPLKCDPHWLLQTIAAYRARYREDEHAD